MFDLRDHGGIFGSGKSNKLNIYSQLTEPTKKDGLWVKTTTAFRNITSDYNLWSLGSPSAISANNPISLKDTISIAIGTDIYVLNGTGNRVSNYKYNTLDNTWTKLADIPYNPTNGGAIFANGTDIYVVGGGSTSGTTMNYTYKYDTLTNTWTRLADITNGNYKQGATCDGKYGYVIAGNMANFIKYDIQNNTWSNFASPPYSFGFDPTPVYYKNKIFVFGGSSRTDKIVVYDIATNTWTPAGSEVVSPSACYMQPTILVGSYIYFEGGDSNIYYYDVTKNTVTYSGVTSPFQTSGGAGGVIINNKLYLISTGTNGQELYNANIPVNIKAKPDGTLAIATNGFINSVLKTKLYDSPISTYTFDFDISFMLGFTDIFPYSGGQLDVTLEKYYGDGTKWNKL